MLQASTWSIGEIVRDPYNVHFVALHRYRPIFNHTHLPIPVQLSIIKGFLLPVDKVIHGSRHRKIEKVESLHDGARALTD